MTCTPYFYFHPGSFIHREFVDEKGTKKNIQIDLEKMANITGLGKIFWVADESKKRFHFDHFAMGIFYNLIALGNVIYIYIIFICQHQHQHQHHNKTLYLFLFSMKN